MLGRRETGKNQECLSVAAEARCGCVRKRGEREKRVRTIVEDKEK